MINHTHHLIKTNKIVINKKIIVNQFVQNIVSVLNICIYSFSYRMNISPSYFRNVI